jgi:hypothetical protein
MGETPLAIPSPERPPVRETATGGIQLPINPARQRGLRLNPVISLDDHHVRDTIANTQCFRGLIFR